LKKAVLLSILVVAVLLNVTVRAHAQQQTKVPRIGLLASASPSAYNARIAAFEEGLRGLGYKNIAIERRYADGKSDRLPDFAAQLVDLKVDVILATSDPSVRAAKKATQTIPIVFVNTSDPVGDGFVASLAQPGGNATGLTLLYPELSSKRLELFKETFPKVSRLAVLFGSGSVRLMKDQTIAAQALRMHVISLPVAAPSDVGAAFEKAKKERAQGLLINPSPQITTVRERILEFAATARLPAMYPYFEYVNAGGLMSYGPDSIEQYRRAAAYVDKILKGVKPADLPVEQPMKFEFIINLKAAKQIGLTIPPEVLARADKVIR
jgi:putative tryptophan/tyrosine transport system substrate-binding protein